MSITSIFRQLIHVLGLCPNCGSIFRVADSRPRLKWRAKATLIDELEAEEIRLDKALEQVQEREAAMRQRARQKGQQQAKARLRDIDHVFCGANLDPQDVKVICDPVEYVVFDGMSEERTRRVLLLSKSPGNMAAERQLKSIEHAVCAGNYSFSTMRVDADGNLVVSNSQ